MGLTFQFPTTLPLIISLSGQTVPCKRTIDTEDAIDFHLIMSTLVIVNKLHRKKVVGRWSVSGR